MEILRQNSELALKNAGLDREKLRTQLRQLEWLVAERNREIERLQLGDRGKMALTESSDAMLKSVDTNTMSVSGRTVTTMQRIETSTNNTETIIVRDRVDKFENDNHIMNIDIYISKDDNH